MGHIDLDQLDRICAALLSDHEQTPPHATACVVDRATLRALVVAVRAAKRQYLSVCAGRGYGTFGDFWQALEPFWEKSKP